MAELTYKSAGVDVEAARKALFLAKQALASTQIEKLALPSGFFTGGIYLPNWVRSMRKPILLANADGIGTLTHEAITDRKATARMGRSVVNHNLMDLVASGGRPAAFVNTIDWHKVQPDMQATLIKGMALSCRELGVVILGGETASLPVLIQAGQVVVNGMMIGFVDDKDKIDGPKRIKPTDVVIGIQSTGLLINGISLARKVIFDVAGLQSSAIFPGTKITVSDEMTKGTPNYARYLLPFIDKFRYFIRGVFNVTGDGIPGNLVRILPESTEAVIYEKRLPKLAAFEFLRVQGVPRDEMWNTFNLGIGVGIVTGRKSAQLLLKVLAGVMPRSLSPVVIGSIQSSSMSEPIVSLV